MGQTQPRGSKTAEELEGIQGVTVPELPENRDMDIQEPVFGSPIDSELFTLTTSLIIIYSLIF